MVSYLADLVGWSASNCGFEPIATPYPAILLLNGGGGGTFEVGASLLPPRKGIGKSRSALSCFLVIHSLELLREE